MITNIIIVIQINAIIIWIILRSILIVEIY